MSKVERSNCPDRFSIADIRAGVAETKRKMAEPGYAQREAQRIAEVEKRSKSRGTRFPEIASRSGTRPALSVADHRRNLLDKLNR